MIFLLKTFFSLYSFHLIHCISFLSNFSFISFFTSVFSSPFTSLFWNLFFLSFFSILPWKIFLTSIEAYFVFPIYFLLQFFIPFNFCTNFSLVSLHIFHSTKCIYSTGFFYLIHSHFFYFKFISLIFLFQPTITIYTQYSCFIFF